MDVITKPHKKYIFLKFRIDQFAAFDFRPITGFLQALIWINDIETN